MTVKIEKLSHDGRGIAVVEGKTLFIQGSLPGETVTYRVLKKHRQYSEAEVVDVLTASPQRTQPGCAHFAICGGCSLQHMSTASQLQLKQQVLLEQLQHFGRVTPETVLPPLTLADWGYRHKARLGVKFVIKKNKVLVGFREKQSRYLADIEHCPVLHPSVGERLPAIRELITTLECFQQIPQIEVAIGDTETALVFRHLMPLSDSDQEKLLAFGKAHALHIYLQPNPPLPLKKLWPEHSAEELRYSLPDEQIEFLFHPLDFTQINLTLNRQMVAQAIALLAPQPNETILDLFCGIGNFTLAIARHAQQVTGIEGGNIMVERARKNAEHNDLNNVSFFAANLQEPSPQAPWIKKPYDKILLDPPRTGAKEILPFFAHFAAKRIVYVSCNPATLARDAGELVHQYGYQLKQVGVMNMFPHTTHIEAMAVFEK